MGYLSRSYSASVRVHAMARIVPHALDLHSYAHANAALLLERNATRFADRPALLFGDETYSWAEVERETNRWAQFFLSHGMSRGSVAALLMDNRPEYVFALLALSRIRAVTACINTNLSGRPLAHAINAVNPSIIVVGSEHLAVLTAMRERRIYVHSDRDGAARAESINAELESHDGILVRRSRPDTSEPMAYLYTSGTTGLPKAAVVTNQRFLLTAYAFGKAMHEACEHDVIYVPLPLYHGTAQWTGFGACLATGAAMAFRRRFSASSFWADAVRFGATRMVYIGEVCRYLLHQPVSADESRHSIRVAAGNGLRPDVWTPFQRRCGIPMIREFYGATEGNAPLANLEGRPGMLGRLAFGQALVAFDVESGTVRRDGKGRAIRVESAEQTGLFIGRISAVTKFDGYVDARATEAKVLRDVFAPGDTWFNTGDLLTLHEDGWLSFADRVGDTFRWKGENVSTNEVADVLDAFPAVLEANVYGVLVAGSEGRAGMASLHATDDFDLDAFRTHVMTALPAYARPLFLRLQTEMRVTGTFKHQKTDYRNEGYDPTTVRDPLFALLDGRYVPIDDALFARIRGGQIVLG